jgi:pectinesterase
VENKLEVESDAQASTRISSAEQKDRTNFKGKIMRSFKIAGLAVLAVGLIFGAGVGCAAEPGTPASSTTTATASTSVPVGKTVVVAADGSGDYKTVQEAVDAVPANNATRFVIRIKAGKYEGQVIVPKNKPNVVFEGGGVEKTILSWSHNDADPEAPGTHFFNPGVHIQANDFRAANLMVENTAGDRGQALALLVSGDRAAFENCRILGWQDTLLLESGRQYFKDCYVEGRVDFIYGAGTAVFDRCEIHSKNGGYVTAASTPQEAPYGFVFLNCKLTGDATPWVDPTGAIAPKVWKLPNARLGRPWRPYASVTFINSEMGDHIMPEGWNNWGKVENEKTARYAEYGSKTPDGKPLDVSKRVPWAKQLTAEEAAQYTIANILGGADNWNPVTTASNATGSKPVTKAAAVSTPVVATLVASTPARGKVRLVLAGDSTVTDDAGWGTGFKKQFKPEVEVINLAKGGRSSGSFVVEGRWKQTLELKPDYVLIQFGHNDQPGHGPERETDPKTTYRANMERYVDEAKAAGIKPILVTSLSRRQWGKDGKINSTLTSYVETVKQIAVEKNVPLLDLHALSIALYEKLGKEGVLEISPQKNADPNSKNSDTASTQNQGYDGTHLNAKGGEIVGKIVADALRQAVPALAPYLKSE